MRRVLSLVILVLAAGAVALAVSPHLLFNGQTGNSTSAPYINATSARVVGVHIWCDGGTTCTGTVQIQVANDVGEPGYVVATITNPGNQGELWYTNGKVITLVLTSSSGNWYGSVQE